MEHCNTVSLYTIKLMMIIQGTIELRYNIRSAWFLDIRICNYRVYINYKLAYIRTYVTGFGKTDHSVTFDILRNTNLKY